MLSTFAIVAPIFGLVLAGYGCRRLHFMGPNASPELNRFVVYLALPAMLFQLMTHTSWAALYQPGFVLAFGLGMAAVFGATLLLRRRARGLADASLDGLNAAYANVGFMGFPLCLAVLGQQAMALVTIATILTACVLFGSAIVLIELGRQNGVGALVVTRKVGLSLLKNPLLLAPLLGALTAAAGVPVPAPFDAFLRLLGGAASPCALVALGLFLAEKRAPAPADAAPCWPLVAAKLVGQPLLTWWLAYRVFMLPPLLAETAVLLAALPTGTGPFMLAEFYGREALVTARSILVSTVLSLLSITAYLAWSAARAH